MRSSDLVPFTAHRIELRPGMFTLEEGDDPFQELTTKVVVEQCAGSLAGKRVLDLGCLEGGYTVAFARLGAREAIGIEARQENLDRCRFLQESLRLPNVQFEQGDVRDISPDALGRFDVVFAQGILYHLDDPVALLDRISALTLDFALLDTHVAQLDSWAHGCSSRLSARTFAGKQYVGREATEYPETTTPEEIEGLLWASYGNSHSFWLTEESLVDALHDVGFPYVCKVYVPRPYRCGERCTAECRIVLVAKKAWPATQLPTAV